MSASTAPSPNATKAARPLKRRQYDWPKHIVLMTLIGIELFPLYMMLQVSFKDTSTFLQQPWLPLPISQWDWSNWSFGIKLIAPYLANTVFVTTCATFGTFFFALLGAYFFARSKLPGKGILWTLFLILLIMPGVGTFVPVFMLLKSLHLLNTLFALIILGVSGGQVLNVFILRHFIEDIPKDLFEAAEMDGASHFQRMVHIVIPMAAPIIGTLSIFAFMGGWNDFMMPLIILRDQELFTLGVGLIYLEGEYVKPWGKIMATYFISSVPLLIMLLFTMKFFVRSFSAGAVKG
ncbi:ABC transporter permease [Cephaloticoccus capnophilus]|uniref:ABC transporter permease n=1 Tax=Cephaloticoccus capnophilus TaxID=1548208 RepID=A0A139SPU0_9BACT|nr:carbohydrate ABC transporter permease [Cephaloticoccus capnophilus]KXU36609.1 ABC transporter permease [Cephaloticoccus capnophilus]